MVQTLLWYGTMLFAVILLCESLPAPGTLKQTSSTSRPCKGRIAKGGNGGDADSGSVANGMAVGGNGSEAINLFGCGAIGGNGGKATGANATGGDGGQALVQLDPSDASVTSSAAQLGPDPSVTASAKKIQRNPNTTVTSPSEVQRAFNTLERPSPKLALRQNFHRDSGSISVTDIHPPSLRSALDNSAHILARLYDEDKDLPSEAWRSLANTAAYMQSPRF